MHLLHDHRIIDLGEQLAAFDVIAGLDQHRHDPSGVTLVGNWHVVTGCDCTGEADAGGYRLLSGNQYAYERNAPTVGERLGRLPGTCQQLPGNERDEQERDQCAERPLPAARGLRGPGQGERWLSGLGTLEDAIAADPGDRLAPALRGTHVFGVRAHARCPSYWGAKLPP